MPLYDPRSTQYTSDAAATTFTPPDILQHAAGDLLLYGVGFDGTPASALTATGGWTVQDAGANSDGLRTAFVYKKAASGSETAPTFTSPVSSNWGVTLKVWVDSHATPIDSSAFSNAIAASTTHTSPALTTNNNGCGLFYLFAADCAANPRAYLSPNQLVPDQILAPNNTFLMMTGTRRQETAGAIPSVTALQDQSQGGQSLVIAIRSADGVNNMQDPPEGVNMIRLFSEHNGFNSYSAPNTLAASINGINCHTATPTGSEATSGPIKLWGRATSFLGTTTLNANYWEGPVITGLSLDATAGPLVISWQVNTTASTRIGNDGVIMVLKSSTGNYRSFQLRKRTEMVAGFPYTKVLDAQTATVYASVGTVNLSNITEIGILMHRSATASGTANALILSNFAQLTTAKLIGGGVNNKLGFNLLASQLPYYYGAIQWATALGTFTELKQSVDIGNNSVNTYFNHSASAFQFPRVAKTTDTEFDVGALRLAINVKTTATGELDLSSSIIKAQNQQAMAIDAGAANPSMNTAGLSTIGFVPTLKTGFNMSGAVFRQSGEIDGKAATYTSCSFSEGTNTGGAAMKLDTGASLLSCAFIDGAETYALRIPTAGTYSINSTTFTGYTTAINVTAASGTVTFNLAAGQAAPTYITAGATVVFAPPTTQATATVLAGSRVQLYNVTQATEIVNEVEAGTSWSHTMVTGVDADASDVLRVRITKIGRIEFESTAVFSGISDVAFLATQPEDTVYTEIGIDGATVTEFALDGVNVQIDMDDPDGETTVQRGWAWYSHTITTEAGIRDLFGGFEAQDIANYRANLPFQFENVSSPSLPIRIGGGYVYRADGDQIVATTGGSIILDSGKVYIPASGTLTAAQVWSHSTRTITAVPTGAALEATAQSILADTAALDARLPVSPAAVGDIPSAAVITDAVWDEVLTGATHNVPTSAGRRLRQLGTRLALEGSVIGTPTTTSVQTDATQATSGFYNDQTFRFTSGALTGQAYPVANYNGTTKTFTFDEPFTSAPSAADTFEVDSDHVHPIGQIQSGLAKTTELTAAESAIITQVNANETKIDLIETKAQADARQALLIAEHDATQSTLATVLADTNELQTNQGNWVTATGFATPANVTAAQVALVAEHDATQAAIAALPAAIDAATPAEVATAITNAALATHADANVINEGVQLASLFIPHSTDLP